MDNNVSDVTIEILRAIQRAVGELQSDVGGLKSDVGELKSRMDLTNARLEALSEMTMARFTTVETVLMDMSARTHFGSTQTQAATTRYDRELAELRARVTKLESSREPE
jgi:hypothetical protein